MEMSLTSEAFERIRNAIVSGALDFGEHLSETQIAMALDMSKAPVRAAFFELKDKGLVKIIPQSGTYVFSPTADDVRTLSQFRAVLENEAIRWAAERNPQILITKLDAATRRMRDALSVHSWEAYRAADSEYHFSILEECGNRYLLKAYHLSAAALEALRVRLQNAGNFREQSYTEHIEIAQFLKEGKTEEACKLLRQHILVINDSLDAMMPAPNKIQRSNRNYDEVFNQKTNTTEVIPNFHGANSATRSI
jgi:DNA-binding GntR family transcriptional regulator